MAIRRQPRWFIGLALIAALVVVAAALTATLPGRDERSTGVGADPATLERRALTAALQRIVAESARPSPPTAEAAPTPDANAPTTPQTTLPLADGYAFVGPPEPMTVAPRGDAAYRPTTTRQPDDLAWLESPVARDNLRRQALAAGRDWAFGWVLLADAAEAGGAAALAALGGQVLGRAGNLARARLPADPALLANMADLPQVRGLGSMSGRSKLAMLAGERAALPLATQSVPVLIALMTDDPDGRWRKALADLGAVVGAFHADIRVYPAVVDDQILDAVAAADFVQAIAPIRVARAAHDLVVPALGADALRAYDVPTGLFNGVGDSVPVAVMDTGLNIEHLDISSNRASVCGANFQTSLPSAREDNADLWHDAHGHGTHVTGTFVGNGHNDPNLAGVAPTVRHIRFAKVLNSYGFGESTGIMRGMDFLATASGCPGGTSTAPTTPLIVNMSLSSNNRLFNSRSMEERKLDGLVWSQRQLYVVAQGNSNIHGFSNYGAAKNSLAVGATRNDGELASFSSSGPTADGRLKPQVVAPGVLTRSARGDGSVDGYSISSGTSMSAPAVAGIAALLMGSSPAHQRQPALTRARLMASAIKPDPWLDAPARFPAHNGNGPGTLQNRYGLGKASARTSVLNRNRADGWVSGSATAEPRNGEYAWRDISVPNNASRLDLVLTWDEPPSEAIGGSVLNDLDLWLDRQGDCGAGACGEWSSTSPKDNVEWIIVRNPAPGTYRAKIVAERTYGTAPRAALAWTVIRGPSTPTLEIAADQTVLRGDGEHELTLTLTTNGYVAAGTELLLSCRRVDGNACEGVTISDLRAQREDGLVSRDLNASRGGGDNPPTPREANVNFVNETLIGLGEIGAGERQTVSLTLSHSDTVSALRFHFAASAWNARPATAVVTLLPPNDSEPDPTTTVALNDAFADAMTLQGASGSVDVDLLYSTTEPGEFLGQNESRHDIPHTLWYRWRTPAQGLYRFEAQISPGATRVDILQGDGVSGLRRLASATDGAAVFAERNTEYRIQLLGSPTNAAGTLRWARGRPVNDDFRAATIIAGDTGSVKGATRGASIEPGEWFGEMAATVWYRWNAPQDGLFAFQATQTGSLHVMVFEGNELSDLRLVSDRPTWYATMRAKADRRYHVAVATPSLTRSAGPFTLLWSPADEADTRNNDYANAESLPDETESSAQVGVTAIANVEPDEPVETGVRTNWWVWQAPSTERFTFRLRNTQSQLWRMTALVGETLADARVIATSDPFNVVPEFVLDATESERYRISLGFPANDLAAFQTTSADDEINWAPTPPNDELAMAALISASNGTAEANNAFGTTEDREPTKSLGHSSLWWEFVPTASGSYRFSTTGLSQTLAAYQRAGDGFASLALIDNGVGELIFNAVAGARYAIRVGTTGREGGAFTLVWALQNDAGQDHFVPLFPAAPSADAGGLEGFVRVVNHSDNPGEATVTALDDDGNPGEQAVTIRLLAKQRVHFNAGDLERGTTAKPLTGAVGTGQGDWRLRIASDLNLEVLAYARAKPSGFLTSLHDLAPCVANSCQVAVFNPASNRDQVSRLRVINDNDDTAAVTITGVDDAGASPGTAVEFQLPGGHARTLTAADLETGEANGLSGALGNGAGKWYLTVEADRPIAVMSLMRSPTGHLTNLSTGAP